MPGLERPARARAPLRGAHRGAPRRDPPRRRGGRRRCRPPGGQHVVTAGDGDPEAGPKPRVPPASDEAQGSAEAWSIRRVLTWAADDLKKRGYGSPRLDAELILGKILGLDRIGLLIDAEPSPHPERARSVPETAPAPPRLGDPSPTSSRVREFYGQSLPGRSPRPRPAPRHRAPGRGGAFADPAPLAVGARARPVHGVRLRGRHLLAASAPPRACSAPTSRPTRSPSPSPTRSISGPTTSRSSSPISGSASNT